MPPKRFCATRSEVWASNRNVAHSVELPGLQGWIYAAPLELGQDGGDIHYLSTCDYGVLSRVVLADVSGHGRTVAAVAEQLLRLVRRHMNRLEQPALLSELSTSLRTQKRKWMDAAAYAALKDRIRRQVAAPIAEVDAHIAEAMPGAAMVHQEATSFSDEY